MKKWKERREREKVERQDSEQHNRGRAGWREVGEGSLDRDGDGEEDAHGARLALSSSPCQGQG